MLQAKRFEGMQVEDCTSFQVWEMGNFFVLGIFLKVAYTDW